MNIATEINKQGIRIDREAAQDYLDGLTREDPDFGRPGMTDHARKTWTRTLEKILTGSAIDGIFYPNYQYKSATSGRWTCRGLNMQGLQRELRHLFVARPGHKLVSLDLKQVQYRIVAHLAGETKLLEKMLDPNFDIHADTAEVAGVDRDMAKVLNFSILFGASVPGTAARMRVSENEAEKFINAWFSEYTEIRDFIHSVKEEVSRTGRAVTPGGLVRMLDPTDPKSGDRAVAHIVQGMEAELVEEGITRLQSSGYRVLIQCHDEVVVEVVEDTLPEEILNIIDLWSHHDHIYTPSDHTVADCWTK